MSGHIDTSYLNWPFFTEQHRAIASSLDAWADLHVNEPEAHDQATIDAACRNMVKMLGNDGWLRHSVANRFAGEQLDVRTLCLIREILARHSGIADFAFAMQGLGTGAISLFGSESQQQYLNDVAAGNSIAAFALTEPDAGSDVAAISTTANRTDSGYLINGEKTYISNGGIADFYVVFARTADTGARGLSAFIIDADNPGLEIAERIEVIAPHPLARLCFKDCEVSSDARIGIENEGFKIAMATLDVFRTTVGAAALGFARHALSEALQRATQRELFGAAMAELPIAQSQLAEMALDIDASALLIYRSAWTKDSGAERVTREAAMAKLHATESAQTVIDKAVQLFGGLGVTRGSIVEQLYREIRALRIYEGASEVQKLVIARQLLTEVSEQ